MIFNMTSGKMKTPVLNTAYPADVTVNAGTSATFQVAIAEDGLPKEYTYQWYVGGAAVSGATSASYTRDTASDKGVYSVYCVVTNKAGSVTTRTAALTVRKTPVLSSSYPANASVVNNTAVTSKVTISTAGYPTTYTYQWYKNGSAVSGATGSSYTFTPTATGTTTLYCKVTNAAGTVTSRTATITANPLYLIKAGVAQSTVTLKGLAYDSDHTLGGTDNTPTMTSGSGYLQINGSVYGYWMAYVSGISLAGKTLKIDGTFNIDSEDRTKLAIWTSVGTYISSNMVASASLTTSGASIDISSLSKSGTYLIGITSAYNKVQQIKNMYLT